MSRGKRRKLLPQQLQQLLPRQRRVEKEERVVIPRQT